MQQSTITLTKTALLKYTLFSIVLAAITLITIILPAEYNIDPTGVGHTLGLTVFNTTSTQIETSASSQEVIKKESGAIQNIEIKVPAQSGVEYKFTMEEHQKLSYQWITSGTALYFDLHGEPKGDTTGYFESYAIATVSSMKGSFTSPFSGEHGWYWENKSDSIVTVQLTFRGEYSKHGLK